MSEILISKVFAHACYQQSNDRMVRSHLIAFSMFLAANAVAQKDISVEWRTDTVAWVKNERGRVAGIAGPITGVHHEVFIIGGGANFPNGMPWENGEKKYYNDLSVYSIDGLEFIKNFKLPFTTAYGANCSTPQGVIYAGGENENGLSDKVLLIQWSPVSKKIKIRNLANLPQAVTNASITFYDNILYLMGGETRYGTTSNFLCLDLSNPIGQWKQLPSLPISVSHAVGLTQLQNDNGNIFLIGGRSKKDSGISDIHDVLYQYNIKEKSWIKKASMPYGLCAGTGIVAYSSYILMFGGDTGKTFTKVEKLIAAIQNESDEIKKHELVIQKNKIQSEHPGFGREVLVYRIEHNSWTALSPIPFEAPVTTTAIKQGDAVIIPSGEVKAGIRAPRLLVGKLSMR